MVERRFPEENSYTPPSDEARRKMVEALSEALRGALNEVKTHDVEVIGDALQLALGERQFSIIADYLVVGDRDDDGGTDWMIPDEFEMPLPEGDIPDPFTRNPEETAKVH